MATCPNCKAELGLKTSFALANIWRPLGIHGPNPRTEFQCLRCGATLTYRYEAAGAFWLLAIAPLLIVPVFWTEFGIGTMWLFGAALVLYWLLLSFAFSLYVQPRVADPSLEDNF